MPTKKPPYEDADAPSRVTEKLSDAASQAQSKTADLGHTVADKIDENRGAVASGLETVASTLHEKAGSLPGGEKVTDIAHTAADKFSSTADYVREHGMSSMMADLEQFAKNNPGVSLLAAAVIGYLLERTLSRAL